MAVDPLLTPTIVASWGGIADTCYLTVEEADSIAGGKIDADKWTALNAIQKRNALITATRVLDHARSWRGCLYFYNQSLKFPRALDERSSIGASEPDSAYYDWLTTDLEQQRMKVNVKLATFEQALWLVRLGGFDKHAENQARGIASYSESYGSVSESTSYDGTRSAGKLCPEAQQLMREYFGQPKLVRG